MQNKYSIKDFAATVRAKTGKGREMTDTHLVQEWVKQYPGDKEHLDDMGQSFVGAVEFAEGLRPSAPAGPATPKPLPLVGSLSHLDGSTKGLVKDLVFGPTLPELPEEVRSGKVFLPNPVASMPGPIAAMGELIPPKYRAMPYEATRQMSSPFDLATLGALGTANVATKLGAKGLAAAASRIDQAANLGLLGIGASDVADAAFDSKDVPLSNRLLQGGVGALTAGAGALGLKFPLVPKRQAAIPSPIAPPKPEPLALPPIGGTTPTETRFYAGPAGIADTAQQYPVHLSTLQQPLLGNIDNAATPTLAEIGQMRNLPTIEAARGPNLSGLHGTGGFPVLDPAADLARQEAAAMAKVEGIPGNQLPGSKALPPKTGGVNPGVPGASTQTGIGGKVDFTTAEELARKGTQEIVQKAPVEKYFVKKGTTLQQFDDLDEAIEMAQRTGQKNIGVSGNGGRKIEWVPFGDEAAEVIPQQAQGRYTPPAKAPTGTLEIASHTATLKNSGQLPPAWHAEADELIRQMGAGEYGVSHGRAKLRHLIAQTGQAVPNWADETGKAAGDLLRPLAGGLTGAATGAAMGDTPGERLSLGLLGAVGGGVMGAPRRTGRFVRNAADKATAPAPLPELPPLPKVGSGEHAESVMHRLRGERGLTNFPRGTRAEDMLKAQQVPQTIGRLPDAFPDARKHIRKAMGQEEGAVSGHLVRKMAGGAIGGLAGGALGDTPEERLTLGLIGAVTGASLPKGARNMPKASPYISQTGQDLLAAQAKEGTKGADSILPTSTKLKTGLVTRFAPNDLLDDTAQKNIGRKLTATERSGDTNRRVFGGQSGRVRATMLDMEDVRKSTKDIDEEVRNYLNMKAFVHAHNTLLKRAGKLQGKERQELLDRLADGKTFPLGFTEAKAKQAIVLAEQSPQFARVKEAADKIFKINRETLDSLYQNGIINKEGYEELVSRGEEYVPLFRRSEGGLISDDGGATGLIANLERDMIDRWKSAGLSLKHQKSIKALHGSERITQDPYEASLYARQLAEREIGRNEAAKTLFNLKQIDPNGVGEMIVPLDIVKNGKHIGKNAPPPGMMEINFRDGGEIVSYAVPNEIAQAQLLIDGKSLVAGISALGQTLGLFKGILQATATAFNPKFMIGNVPRDFDTSRRFLKGNRRNPVDYAKGLNEWRKALASRLKNDENFREALRSRSLHGTLQEQFNPTSITIGSNQDSRLKKVVRSLSDLSKVLEETTKLAAYNRMKKTGLATEDIAKEVRKFGGSPDFADMGTKISEGYNLAFMFLNPAIQGIAQNIRGIARNPKKAAGMFGTALGASIALYKWNGQYTDDQGRPEIEHVPKYDRDTSFVIILPQKDPKTGRHHYLTIAKKSHAARLFYNTIQDAIQMAGGDTKITAPQLGMDVASQFFPGSIGLKSDDLAGSMGRNILASANPLFRLPVESLANYKSFEGMPIESQRIQSLPRSLRYNATTGRTYRKLGELTGLSPKMIQHNVEGLFSAPGQMVMGALDSLQEPTSVDLSKVDKAKKTPFVGPILGSFLRGGGDEELSHGVNAIYSAAQKAKEQKAALRQPSTRDKADKVLASQAEFLEAATRQLAKWRRQREQINSGEMKVSDPVTALQRIRKQEEAYVRQVNARLTKLKK